jgi:AcrR family transcriptional regulator
MINGVSFKTNVMGVAERKAREKQTLRREILDAARDLFATEGYANVSMRKIAEKIEYSPTTIYLYFQDKTELVASLCEETFSKLSARLGAATAGTADPVGALRAELREYIRFGLEHPNDYRFIFMPPAEACENPQALLREGSYGRRAFDYLRGSLTGCAAAGAFHGLDVEATAQALFCCIHGVTASLIASPAFPWVERDRLIERTLDVVIAGLNQ